MDYIEKRMNLTTMLLRFGKLRRKWISTENTFLEKEKTEMSDWYWSPEETKMYYKKFKNFSKWREYNSKNSKRKNT